MSTSPDELVVLWEAEDLVVVDKPAGRPTEPDRDRRPSVRDAVQRWMRARGRAGAPHAVSRLDVGVTGAVLFALTARGAAWAAHVRADGRYRRGYLALCAGAPPDAGAWEGPVDGRPARTDFRVAARAGAPTRPICLLIAWPRTGRKHQIRIHAASSGAPLAGDRRYGGPTSLASPTGAVVAVSRPMLHAAALSLPDPTGAPIAVRAEVPQDMRRAWTASGGLDAAWAGLSVLDGCAEA